MTKTRMNHIVGVRIRWSMCNDTTWRKSNRFGAYALMLGLVVLAAAATAVYAHKVYLQEIETV